MTPDLWLEFINNALASDLYAEVLAQTGQTDTAAGVVLLDSYFDGLDVDEKKTLLRDDALFRKYVDDFTGIMAGIRYDKNGYDQMLRAAYLGMIKSLLSAQKKDGKIVFKNRYDFIKTLSKFTSDSEYIMKNYKDYKDIYLNIR